jgi:tRNA modification GTPase
VIPRRELVVSDDTIVGIATPPGTGAVGMIRVSGPGAIAITSRLIRLRGGKRLESCSPRSLNLASIVDHATGDEMDIALVATMPAPSSYTGDDVVEISCHGNPVLLGVVVQQLVVCGARLAEPGEFTRRAYLNGRMDLLQVEAIAELISARSERAIHLAARQLRGVLSGEIRRLRERLLDLMAGLEVTLDFPEEGVGLSRQEAMKEAQDLQGCLERIVANARHGRAIQDGLTVVLVGAPNAGKSSVLNRLLGAERAIVSAVPGTTRDLVDGTVLMRGVALRLVDGAGLGTPRDAVDAEGMRRIREALTESDLAVVVLDMSRPISAIDREILKLTVTNERLVIANKSDLRGAWQEPGPADCVCSALTGEGLASLTGLLEKWVERRAALDGDEAGSVATLRTLDGLSRAEAALRGVAHALDGVPVEAALVDLRQAQMELDRILGIEADEAILDRIFSSFCIGK